MTIESPVGRFRPVAAIHDVAHAELHGGQLASDAMGTQAARFLDQNTALITMGVSGALSNEAPIVERI